VKFIRPTLLPPKRGVLWMEVWLRPGTDSAGVLSEDEDLSALWSL
jgi:hypothetical protein